ncbi:MAG: hypothetical protein SFW36_20385 [Leptolyngbyaceae cyanobacterium bins.59]|nr:hypothetical protein [Leptolyngbyaceae cyanobacterium bins.59]
MKNFWSLGCLLSLALPASVGILIPQLNSPAVAQGVSQDQRQNAEWAVSDAVTVRGLAARPRITKMTFQQGYGLASWLMGEAGGIVALQRQGNDWRVVKLGGGMPMAADISRSAGIPLNIAQSLLKTHAATPSRDIPSYCFSSETVLVAAETRSYWVSICGKGSQPSFYVGVEKNNPANRVRLPLADFAPEGPLFMAKKGEFMYILAWSAKGKNLTVTQGTRELLREPVLRGL